MNAPPSPVIPCPACHKGLPISVARYPEQGGTFPCPSCKQPLLLPPKAQFLAAFAAASGGAVPGTAATPASSASPATAAPRPAGPGGAPPAATAATAPPAPPEAEPEEPLAPLWLVAFGGGGGVEEVGRDHMRELIRDGLVLETTEVAPVGTRDYRPASEYPELTRWLSMAAERRRIVYIRPVATTAETMVQRALQGLAYPIRGGALGTVIGLAILSVIPVLSLLAVPLASFYVVAAVRESARGEKALPAWVDSSDLMEVLKVWLKTVLVSLVALFPVIGWIAFWYLGGGDRSGPEALVSLFVGLAVAGLVSFGYYPACLATVAVWDSVVDSLNPAYIYRVIRTIGSDYAIFLTATILSWAAGMGLRLLFGSLLDGVPFIGAIPGHMASLWASLYAAHLLGWAVHRNQHDLGWE